MNTFVYQLKHSERGELNLELDNPGKCIQFHCHWPFDLSTNEWISMSSRFPLKEYMGKVSHLSRSRCAVICGTCGGKIVFRVFGKRKMEICVTGDSKTVHEEYRFQIQARPRDLMPLRSSIKPTELT